jgi:hypothetical protein
MSILALMYCQIDVPKEHTQHTAMIFGRALVEVVAMYTNKLQQIHVSIIPPIDMAIVALSPKAWNVSPGLPV